MDDLLKVLGRISGEVRAMAEAREGSDPEAARRLRELWYASNRVWHWESGRRDGTIRNEK